MVQRHYILAVILVLMLVSGIGAQYRPLVNDPVLEVHLRAEIYGEDQPLPINFVSLSFTLIMALATRDGVYVYDIEFNLLQHLYDEENIMGVSWNPDGTQLALTHANEIEIWDWDGKELTVNRSLVARPWVYSVTWSPDGNYIAAEGVESVPVESRDIPNYSELVTRIHIWNTTDWSYLMLPDMYSYVDSSFQPRDLSWQPNHPSYLVIHSPRTYLKDKSLYLDGGTNTIFIVDAATGQTVNELRLDGDVIFIPIAWHPNGSLIAATDFDPSSILLFDATDGSFVRSYSAYDGEDLVDVDWNVDGTMIVAGNFVVDVEHDLPLGKFQSGYPIALIWLDKGIYGESHQGEILVIERYGTVTIQDISRLPFYLSPTLIGFIASATPTPLPPPIANAGEDQFFYANQTTGFEVDVTLDGSASFSPNGEIVSYVWESENRIRGTEAVIETSLGWGVHHVTLTVTDEEGRTATDEMIVEVSAITATPSKTFTPDPFMTPTMTFTPDWKIKGIFQRTREENK